MGALCFALLCVACSASLINNAFYKFTWSVKGYLEFGSPWAYEWVFHSVTVEIEPNTPELFFFSFPYLLYFFSV
jgi:hypothetical protein